MYRGMSLVSVRPRLSDLRAYKAACKAAQNGRRHTWLGDTFRHQTGSSLPPGVGLHVEIVHVQTDAEPNSLGNEHMRANPQASALQESALFVGDHIRRRHIPARNLEEIPWHFSPPFGRKKTGACDVHLDDAGNVAEV